MKYKNIVTAFALIAMPTLASAAPAVQQNPASALSLSPMTRAATATHGKSHMTKEGTLIAGVLALGVIAGGIIAISKDNNGRPVSR